MGITNRQSRSYPSGDPKPGRSETNEQRDRAKDNARLIQHSRDYEDVGGAEKVKTSMKAVLLR
jgi:hypothetical protein